MKIFFHIGTFLCIAMLSSIAVPVFAESAPVYDADNVEQQQFNNSENNSENSDDQNQYLPPPPPPSDQEGVFVPSQPSSADSTQPISNQSASAQSMSVDQRVRRVEQQVNNLQNNDVSERLNALQAEIQTLRGQVEQLMHDLQQAQSQQKSMYADLDKRLSQQHASQSDSNMNNNLETNLENKQTVQAAPNDTPVSQINNENRTSGKHRRKDKVNTSELPKASTNAIETDGQALAPADQPNVAEEQQIYQTAYNFIKAKKYNEAVLALQGMLKKYPYGQFASNAHYWLGELYGLLGKNDKALIEFTAVVKSYSHSPRVPDAQLKVGLIYASQLKWVDAKSAFKKVINHYPGTSSARLASDQLKQIRQAGH